MGIGTGRRQIAEHVATADRTGAARGIWIGVVGSTSSALAIYGGVRGHTQTGTGGTARSIKTVPIIACIRAVRAARAL